MQILKQFFLSSHMNNFSTDFCFGNKNVWWSQIKWEQGRLGKEKCLDKNAYLLGILFQIWDSCKTWDIVYSFNNIPPVAALEKKTKVD